MQYNFLNLCILFVLLLLAENTAAQVPGKKPAPPPKSTGDQFINIRFSDEFTYQVAGIDTLKRLIGNVELNQDSIFIFCDSAIIVNSTYVRAKGNFILQHGVSTSIFSDSAEYRSDTKIAELFSDVSLLNDRQKLFTERLTYNANTKIATYLTGATLTDDTTYLRSVKGYFNTDTDDIFFKDSVVVVGPDLNLRSDTLKFNASSQIATFLAPTLITQDSAKIYTEAGFYNLKEKKASFVKNPQYLKNDQKAWARVMRYDGNLKEVTLVGEAHFEDSTTYATADFITYNERQDVTTLDGNAFIRDENRTITGENITYDALNKTYTTRGRSHIVDGEQILDADQVDYDKERDIGAAAGNVIWMDTTEKMTVVCEFAEHSKKRNYLKASGGKFGRPYLIKVIDGDSLFVSADTLMSVEVVLADTSDNRISPVDLPVESQKDSANLAVLKEDKNTATSPGLLSGSDIPPALFPVDTSPIHLVDSSSLINNVGMQDSIKMLALHQQKNKADSDSTRLILAFHDVRIYKSDLQGICDSMSYSTLDSMFRLYKNPVLWSDTTQFTADTVQIQLANDKIDRMLMRQNSFIINTKDSLFFNQIKGKNSTAFFEDSELQRVRVVGNAESVYYALDDNDAYIGVNQTVCSEMLIQFGANEIEGIRFYTEPKATLFPMKQADHEQLKMTGFNWQIEKQPKSLDDLLSP
jgi:lipopolysaccharide export system protein LptA